MEKMIKYELPESVVLAARERIDNFIDRKVRDYKWKLEFDYLYRNVGVILLNRSEEDMTTKTRYVELQIDEFRNFIELQMGFVEIAVPGTSERVWERKKTPRFSVRIYSTIVSDLYENGKSRPSGEDAIRTVVFDNVLSRIVYSHSSTYRTKNALDNMRERAREAWIWIGKESVVCSCGSLMTVRKSERILNGKLISSKFYGCTNYPKCKLTKRYEDKKKPV
jgi:hypothetical protein